MIGYPVFGKEKVLKCSPHEGNNLAAFYKAKTSLLWKDKYFIRIDGRWEPFCEERGSIRGFNYFPQNKKIGNFGVVCEYTNYRKFSNKFERFTYSDYQKGTLYDYKLTIDFELNTISFCSGKEGEELSCYDASRNRKCDVVD